MKMCISSYGPTLDSRMQRIFGRCSYFLLVDPKSMACESIPNPNAATSGDAGILAAQFLVEKGVSAVLTGDVGPEAESILAAAGIEIFSATEDGTVREAVEAFNQLAATDEFRLKKVCLGPGPMRFRKGQRRKGKKEMGPQRNL